MHLLSKLENDHKLYNPYVERKAQSENGKDKLQVTIPNDNDDIVSDDYKVYKYFSNSAQYPSTDNKVVRPHLHSMNVLQMESDHINHNKTMDYCKRCQSELFLTHCNFCERKRLNLPMNEHYCLKCSIPLKTALNRENGVCDRCRKTDVLCGFCQQQVEICPKCKAVFCLRCHQKHTRQPPRPPLPASYKTNEENTHKLRKNMLAIGVSHEDRPIITNVLRASNNNPKTKTIASLPYQSFDLYESDSEHEFAEGNLFTSGRNDGQKPYSTNVERNSIFHPNKKVEEPKLAVNIRNGQIFVEDLDEKLAKYARNYSDLKLNRSSTTTPRRQSSNQTYDTYPLPLMPSSKNSPSYRQPEHRKKESPAVKMLQQKWEVSTICLFTQFTYKNEFLLDSSCTKEHNYYKSI